MTALFDVPEPPAPEPSPPPAKVTSADMREALRRRFSANPGNGPRYVIAHEVRNAAGFQATRSADAIVVDTWPSSGLAVHGLEIKVSRSDWLRELADPTKAEAFRRYCDFWWLAVSDRAIVRPGELPEGWGLMVFQLRQPAARLVRNSETRRYDWVRPPKERTLRTVTAAPKLRPEPIPRSFLVPLLRAVGGAS